MGMKPRVRGEAAELDDVPLAAMDELLRFLPIFEVKDFRPAESWAGGEISPGVFTWPYPNYAEEVDDFIRVGSQEVWTAYGYVPEHVGAWFERPGFIDSASLDQIKSLLTFIIRGERFCDGHVEAMIKGGQVQAVLRRLATLRGQARPGGAGPLGEPASQPSRDIVIGSLLGGALGDALGYPVEFTKDIQKLRQLARRVPERLAQPGSNLALVSDDTQMSLFTADAMIRARLASLRGNAAAPQVVAASAYLRWLATQNGYPVPESARGWLFDDRRLHHQRAPGNTCLSALRTIARTGTLPTVNSPPNTSKGCGAVMRVAPIGLCYEDRATAFEVARDCSVLTHGHPSGYLSGAYLAALIHDVSRGVQLGAAMDNADVLLNGQRGNEEMVAILERTRELAALGVPDMGAIEKLGEGWIGEEALAIALLCALTCDLAAPGGIEAALWRAAIHPGDSDSTAAITGNLLGAMVGASRLPAQWLADLELRDCIERIGADVHGTCVANQGRSEGDYPLGL